MAKDKTRTQSASSKGSRHDLLLRPRSKLRLISGDHLLKVKHRKTRKHWGRLIEDGQTGMVHAPRGAGKTHFGVGLAVSMATGKHFLGHAPRRPRQVVLLDGEMGSKLMKKRLEEMARSLGAESLRNLRLLTPDMYTRVLPSLGTEKGQRLIDAIIPDDTDVIIVDNLSCWNAGGTEDADGWNPWAEWLLRQKHQGRTVIVVHHTGKSGKQRGTSRKEDALDFVISLVPDTDPDHPDALCFGLEWQKLRAVGKHAAPPLLVTRVERSKGAVDWTFRVKPSLDQQVNQAIKLRDEGKTLREVAAAMGVNPSTISRWLKDAGVTG